MRKYLAFGLVALFIAACAAPVEEIDHTGHITVRNAYVIAAQTAKNTKAFMEVTNNHDEPVTLIGASAGFAAEVTTTTSCASPDRQPSGIVIAGGETVNLSVNQSCLIFLGLKRNLAVSNEVTFTLIFSDGHRVDVTAPVKQQ